MPILNLRQSEVQPGQAERPVEGGASAYEQAGRHIASAYHQAGEAVGGAIAQVGNQYVRHEENLDALDQANYFAHKQEALTQRLTAAKLTSDPSDPNYLDPHDPNAVVKMLDGFDDTDDDFQGKLRTTNGQNTFAQKNAEFRSQAFREATVTQAGLAADDIKNKFDDTINTFLTTAYQNPATGLASIQNIDHISKTLPPGMQGELTRAKQMIAKQAALGMVENAADPLKAAQMAEKQYGAYLGADQEQIQSHAIALDRARREDAQMQHTIWKQHQADVSEAQTGKYLTAIGQGQAPSSAQILTDPNLLPSARVALVDFNKRRAEASVPPNPSLTSRLLGRISLPPDDPHTLTPEEVLGLTDKPGGITQSEASFVLTQMRGPDASVRGQAMTAADQVINSTLDPKGGLGVSLLGGGAQQAAANARLAFLQQYQAGLSQGWSWQSMILPSGEHYILNKDFLSHYKNNSGSLSNLVAPTSPTAPKEPPKNRPSLDSIFGGK